MLDFATLENRSKRFIDRAVDLYDGDSEWHGACLVKDDVVEKACADGAKEATRRSAVRKFIVQMIYSIGVALLASSLLVD
mmetsp:Transcript_2486/g.5265  ORF Transcript_2486/g.5265 Transcript_2486/m.5265 type:complete len:80 (-) Transcript_2486:83-322(-)